MDPRMISKFSDGDVIKAEVRRLEEQKRRLPEDDHSGRAAIDEKIKAAVRGSRS